MHVLRGLAALLVFYAHLCAVGMNDAVTPHAYVPVIVGKAVSHVPDSVIHNYLWLELLLGRTGVNSGHLGVMLFFLISGVVISFSINRTDPVTFLARRAIRVYPTCIAAVALTVMGLIIYCQSAGVVYPFSWSGTLHSAFLTSGWVGQGAVIPVLWTLSAEVVFYLLIALVVSLTRRKLGVLEIMFAGSLCCAIVLLGTSQPAWLQSSVALSAVMKWTSFLAVYVTYMLAGASIAVALRGKQSRAAKCFGLVASLLIYCLAVYLYSENSSGLGTDISGGLKIYVLFITVLLLGKNIGEWRITNFFGNISYPLYLLHIPLSWIILYELTKRGTSIHLAMAAAVCTVMLLAWLLHIVVERPSQILSQKFIIKSSMP